MATPADEEHAVNALPGYHRIRMFALPLAGVAAPDEQRRDRTELGPHACVRPKQQRQSFHRGKPTDVQQNRMDPGGAVEGGEIGQGVSNGTWAAALVPPARVIDEPTS